MYPSAEVFVYIAVKHKFTLIIQHISIMEKQKLPPFLFV